MAKALRGNPGHSGEIRGAGGPITFAVNYAARGITAPVEAGGVGIDDGTAYGVIAVTYCWTSGYGSLAR